MSGFVRFTDAEDDDDVIVNVAHIVAVTPNEPRPDGSLTCCLYLDSDVWLDEGGDVLTFVNVLGTLSAIHMALNAATPQMHPSMLMPASPPPWAPKTPSEVQP